MEAFLGGIGLGLVLAAMVGPVFFALIDTSIRKGKSISLIMAAGISASDATYILFAIIGFTQLASDPVVMRWVGLVGGSILILSGCIQVFKSSTNSSAPDAHISPRERLKAFFKGFILNFLNPSVFLFWISSVGVVSSQYSAKTWDVVVFFSGTISTIFFTDVAKIYMARKLHHWLSPKVFYFLNKFTGLAMIGIGIMLVWDNLQL